jgi:hypothetical protein
VSAERQEPSAAREDVGAAGWLASGRSYERESVRSRSGGARTIVKGCRRLTLVLAGADEIQNEHSVALRVAC